MHIYHTLRDEGADMLYADSSEKRFFDKVEEIANVPVTYSDILEELTGADIMITGLNLPLAPQLLERHLECGAILIQIKRGDDLVSSVGDRAAASLGKMIEIGTTSSWQRILLFIGSLSYDGETGSAIVNGKANTYLGPQTYWAVQGTLEKWQERGGSVSFLPRMSMLPAWIAMKAAHMAEFYRHPVRKVYKDHPELIETVIENVSGIPLQKIEIIKDWRNTIVTLPGIGVKRADIIYDYVNNNCAEKTLLSALYILSTDEEIAKVSGLNSGTSKKIRDWLGFDGCFELGLTVKEELNASERLEGAT